MTSNPQDFGQTVNESSLFRARETELSHLRRSEVCTNYYGAPFIVWIKVMHNLLPKRKIIIRIEFSKIIRKLVQSLLATYSHITKISHQNIFQKYNHHAFLQKSEITQKLRVPEHKFSNYSFL